MTSNLASREILENAKLSKVQIENHLQLKVKLDKSINDALSKNFRPEFLNRVDEVIRFNPLTQNNLQKIIKLQLNELTALLGEQNLELRVDESTIESLAFEAYEPEYGARPLRRILRRRIENPLATKLLENQFIGAKAVRVTTSKESPKSLEFCAEN